MQHRLSPPLSLSFPACSLSFLCATLMVACGGGGGGGGGVDPRVLALGGSWQVASVIVALERGGCVPIGLETATLNLELIGGLVEEGTHIGGYRVSSPPFDTSSPVAATETTLDAVALSEGPEAPDVFFYLAGLYYYPAEDVTVEVSWSAPGPIFVDGDVFLFELDYAVYEGYQIDVEDEAANGSDDDGDGDIDEADEDGFFYLPSTDAFLLCEGSASVRGTRSVTQADLAYEGAVAASDDRAALPFLARVDPDQERIEFVLDPSAVGTARLVGEIHGDAFQGQMPTETGWVLVTGRGSAERLTGSLVELDSAGVERNQRELRAQRIEADSARPRCDDQARPGAPPRLHGAALARARAALSAQRSGQTH